MTITGVSQSQSAPPVQSSSSATSAGKPVVNAHTDSVQISNSAKAAMQEATETQQQTAQEARSGDRQAQRLLAKETARAKADQG